MLLTLQTTEVQVNDPVQMELLNWCRTTYPLTGRLELNHGQLIVLRVQTTSYKYFMYPFLEGGGDICFRFYNTKDSFIRRERHNRWHPTDSTGSPSFIYNGLPVRSVSDTGSYFLCSSNKPTFLLFLYFCS